MNFEKTVPQIMRNSGGQSQNSAGETNKMVY